MRLRSSDISIFEPNNYDMIFSIGDKEVFRINADEAHAFIDCYDIGDGGIDTAKCAFGLYIVECLIEMEDTELSYAILKFLIGGD